MNGQDTLISSHVIGTRLPKRAHLYKVGKAIALAAGLCVAMLTASAANAAAIQLRAWLNGAQVPLAVGGTGIGTASFDTITKLLSWSVTYTGLSGACTNAHFHGPAAAGVSNSPAVSMTCSASPLTGTSAALNPTQEAQLLSGQWYINIHTAANSGGEIRGQVLPVRGDTNGDGKADILWRNGTTGEDYFYFMDGIAIANEGYLRTVPLAWSVAARGDFNGDGKADILWRNSTTGENYIYFMDGVTIASEGYIRTVPLAWSVAGVGDFNSDGKADILWRNSTTGEDYIYFMDGVAIASEGYIRTVPLAWSVMGVGDFDGDGKSDILWRNSTTGENYIYFMNGVTIANEGYIRTVPLAWDGGVGGDFNGDGKSDIFWRNSTTGENYIYFMNGVAIASEGYIRTVASAAWNPAGMGDFNGDGLTDILWRNNTTGEDYIYFMDGVTIANEGYIRTVPLAWSVAGFVGDHGGSSGPSLQLGFHYSGNFFGGTAGQINYPAPVYYIANFQTNDTVTPASVFFTGPSGSGLSNTESVAKFSNNPGPGAGFASPQKTEVPSGGAWSVNYNGQPVNFTLPNPDSTNRGIIIVPTITVSGDTVTAINWQYKNSAGTTVTPPQSFVANVEFGIDGLVNSQTVRLYDQYNIPFETTAHTLGTPVTWSAVTHLAMTIRDNQNNYFTSHWYATNPPAPTITSLNPTSAPVGNTITITGTNFGCTGCVGGVNAVRFTGPGGSGSSGVSALFTINSSTQITATVPAGVQTGTVWMQALGQTTNSAQTFTAQ